MDDNIQRLICRISKNILWKKIFSIIPKCKSDTNNELVNKGKVNKSYCTIVL